MLNKSLDRIADKIAEELFATGKAKRIKVKTLLGYFNYTKRTEENVTKITEILAKRNILINPSIMKLGEIWQLKLNDRVNLLEGRRDTKSPENVSFTAEIYDYKNDQWFEEVKTKEFRTEKEVENKFILPLLKRLDYTEDDRYDGMIINAAHGSKQSKLEVDFALFDAGNENLEGQTLLVVEAKKEDRLYKQTELENAQRQVKSYAVWLSCHFGLITDSKTIRVLDLFPSIKGLNVLLECSRLTLKDNFPKLYSLIGKRSLAAHYEGLIR